ncbi:hypothetical protein N8Z41_02775 [Amylibacter sp.]|nr:hypothetical protein [Amylibacter sp.]
MNPLVIKESFGWNWRAWSHPVMRSEIVIEKLKSDRKLKILEIGAGHMSILSILFYEVASKIDIGSHKLQNAQTLQQMIAPNTYLSNVTKVSVRDVDILSIEGSYDVIVMKSVLGGVFRSSVTDERMNETIKKICDTNLLPSGCLISIDNGNSNFEYFLKNVGSRRFNWKYFKRSSFWDTYEQHGFGVLSVGSFSSRLGVLGSLCDFIIFYIDVILYRFCKSRPTIICSIWKKVD